MSHQVKITFDLTLFESGFFPSDRTSKDIIQAFNKVGSYFLFLFSMSSDSVLDSIVSAAEAMTVSVTTPPRSGAGSAFGTRLSARQGGFSPEGTTSLKLYSVIDINCSDETLCFGVIKKVASAFCIRRNCTTRSHLDEKMSWAGTDGSFVFIRRQITNTVFSEPRLPTSKVPVEVMNDWTSKNRTLEEWTTEFEAIGGTNEILSTAVDVEIESSFLNKAELFRSPAKRKRDPLFEGDDEETFKLNWKGSKYLRTLPTESTELEQLISEGVKKGMITRSVSKIETYISDMGDVLGEVSASANERLESLENNLEVMLGMVQTMKARLGTGVELDEKFSAPTLWGTTSFIADDLVRVSEEVSTLTRDVTPMKMTLKSFAEFDHSKSKQSIDKMVKVVQILLTRVETMGDIVTDVQKDIESVQKRNRHSSPGIDQPAAKSSDDLMDFILSDERHDGPSGSRPSTTIPSSTDRKTNHVRPDTDENLLFIINSLREDVKAMKLKSDDNVGVKFGNLGLGSVEDCISWVETHFKGLRYGLIMDPLLMLDRIFGNDSSDSDAMMKTMQTRLKLKIETGAEAYALNALYNERPRIFHKGRPNMVNMGSKSRLNRMATYADWKSGGLGVKTFITNKMNILHRTMASDIYSALGRSTETTQANVIATMCLTATVTFISQLVTMVDELYDRLVTLSKFSSEQAWSLTTQVLDRIMADLYANKAGVVESLTTESQLSTCAHVLWAAFKTHDVMAVYIHHNFEDHPAVSTEYVKFLATNSGSDKVAKLTETVEGLKGKIATAVEDSKKAMAKADTASAKYSEITKEVASMTRKVKQLEDRGGK